MFVDKLESNLKAINELVADITELFVTADVENFEQLPDDIETCAQFAKLFNIFSQHLEAAKVPRLPFGNKRYIPLLKIMQNMK
ncbi:type I restriction endonuclease subunit R, EcoR124 family [Enterobacter hormaechei]